LEANYAHQQELDMIPLMVQQDYKPQGWLGLILGTRMWYAFWDAERDDDAAFDRRLGSVVREIGERGKVILHEAVPPYHEPTPAPAPALAPAPAPVPALAAKRAAAPAPSPALAAAAPAVARRAPVAATAHRTATAVVAAPPRSSDQHGFTPGLETTRLTLPPPVEPSGGGMGGSLAELSAFMKEREIFIERQQALLLERDAQAKAEAKAERLEFQSQLLKRDAQANADRDTIQALRLQREVERIQTQADTTQTKLYEQQCAGLHSRLEALHGAKLLSDTELHALEDAIVDSLEAAAEEGDDDRVARMVALSERLASDAAFSRQLRRKFA
jgi:hypothetical protein